MPPVTSIHLIISFTERITDDILMTYVGYMSIYIQELMKGQSSQLFRKPLLPWLLPPSYFLLEDGSLNTKIDMLSDF